MSMRRKEEPKMRVLRASELGEYSYCARAWWYRHVLKIAPLTTEGASKLEAGIQAHTRHGRAVALSTTLRTLGIALALLGLLALVLALVAR